MSALLRGLRELSSRMEAGPQPRKLDLAEAAYHSSWYIPAIRELAGRADFRPEPKWIAARLCPPIRAAEAEKALGILPRVETMEYEVFGKVVIRYHPYDLVQLVSRSSYDELDLVIIRHDFLRRFH